MNTLETEKIYLYSRFERFWHWAQAALIIYLVVTGFEVHGTVGIMGFESAAAQHSLAGLSWLVLYGFIIFWQLTTGEWKQYIPTTKNLFVVARYYCYGIFACEPHPVPKTPLKKHNPLQRLTYLGITLVLIPLQVITGLLYYTYNSWSNPEAFISLGTLAGIHTAGGFGMLVFLIVHVYMITTGDSILGHFKAMITGWEEVPKIGVVKKVKEAA